MTDDSGAPGATAATSRSERRRAEQRTRHPVRARLVTLARAVSFLLTVCLLLGSGLAFVYYNRLSSQAGTGASLSDLEGNRGGKDYDRRDMDILMIGTDTRTGTDIPAEDGDGGSLHNTDTIMLIHVPADGSRASVVSFPRDTWVTLPNGEDAKINSAYADGYDSIVDPQATQQQHKDAGQAWLVQTVSAFSGVQVDHFVEVTLAGFRDLTNAVGGVDVNLCEATEDLEYSGADFPAGPQHLDADQALAFVRQRHGLPNYDLDRIKRQQYFMGAVLRKVLDRQIGDLFDPAKLTQLIDALAGTISFDVDLDPLMLADQMRDLAAGDVEFRTIPLAPEKYGKIDGQEIVVPAPEDEIKKFFATLSAPTTSSATSAPATSSAGGSSAGGASATSSATAPAAPVSIDLYLGTTDPAAGDLATADLQARGYQVSPAGQTASASATEIQYGTAMLAQAEALAAVLPGATLRQVAATPAGKLVVVVGDNYPGLGSAGSAPATTATTAPPDSTAASDQCIY